MAFSNVLGSNSFMLALLLIADIFYREGAILDSVDQSTQVAAALGIVVTCVYLWGLLEGKDRTLFRMGIDSIIAVGAYVVGLALLYGASK
jgi:cation:H+ antiporter